MSKVIQIAILGKISGNVNADEVIGDRATIKKMYSSNGEVLPFVSARAVKYAIRQAFRESGFEIDPLFENPEATGQLRLADSARPDRYIDNDLFGYMLTKGKSNEGKGEVFRRHAPIAISYFKALRDTPIKSEFAARFPRSGEKESNPVPFEVEVADFIGRLNVLIYDYVGDFTKSTKILKDVNLPQLTYEERRKRLSAFLEILLTPSYILPRRTNSLNLPEYYAALICMSEKGPLPIYQYLDYVCSENRVSIDVRQLNQLVTREDIQSRIKDKNTKFYIIDYNNSLTDIIAELERKNLPMIINDACEFLFKSEQG